MERSLLRTSTLSRMIGWDTKNGARALAVIDRSLEVLKLVLGFLDVVVLCLLARQRLSNRRRANKPPKIIGTIKTYNISPLSLFLHDELRNL